MRRVIIRRTLRRALQPAPLSPAWSRISAAVMTQYDERVLHDLLVRIDRSLCVGFGDCVTAAPDLFVLDDEGIAVFRDAAALVDRNDLLEACRACPVDALTVIDADGRQIAP